MLSCLRVSFKKISFKIIFFVLVVSLHAQAHEQKHGAYYLMNPRPVSKSVKKETAATQDKLFSEADSKLISQTSSGEIMIYMDRVEEPPTTKSTIELQGIKDPLEGFNRFSFLINDQLFRWIIKPTGEVYGFIIPVIIRKGIKNIAYNAAAPVRILNNLFQMKFVRSGSELLRFLVNTTLGIGGIFDVASTVCLKQAAEEKGPKTCLKKYNEDFGQTLGKYGFGTGFYMFLPLLGPTTVRDGFGQIFDTFLDPATYITGASIFIRFNNQSMHLEDYQRLTGMTIDPYALIRDMYVRLRKREIKQ